LFRTTAALFRNTPEAATRQKFLHLTKRRAGVGAKTLLFELLALCAVTSISGTSFQVVA
jgi:hypothetical protein